MNNFLLILVEYLKTGLLILVGSLISLYILSLILNFANGKYRTAKETAEAVGDNTPGVEATTEENMGAQDVEEELVALITAAVAAYLGKSVNQIKVGFIKRIHQKAPAWAMESRLNPKENP